MRLDELLARRLIPLEINKYTLSKMTSEFCRILGLEEYPIHIQTKNMKPGYAGETTLYETNQKPQATIIISKVLQKYYPDEFWGTLAHELCHVAEYCLDYIPLQQEIEALDKSKIINRLRIRLNALGERLLDDHGKLWQKHVQKINSIYGAGFIQKNIDEKMLRRPDVQL